jgi:hypothetical protein
MAKRKRKEQEPAENKGDAYEPPESSANAMAGPWDDPGDASTAEGQPPSDGGIQGEPRDRQQQRTEKKPHGVIGRYFKDRRVELIDDGNAAGLGIKLSYDDPKERPSEEIKQILKEGDEKRPGFSYRGDLKQWRKRVGSDADPRTAVAIRMDAERRVDAIGDQMSHEERLREERERAHEPGEKSPA